MGDVMSKPYVLSNRAEINVVNDALVLHDPVIKTTWHETSSGIVKCVAQGTIYLHFGPQVVVLPAYYSAYVARNILRFQDLIDAKIEPVEDGEGEGEGGEDGEKGEEGEDGADAEEEEGEDGEEENGEDGSFDGVLTIPTDENAEVWFNVERDPEEGAAPCIAHLTDPDHHPAHSVPHDVEEFEDAFCTEDTIISGPIEGRTNPALDHPECVYAAAADAAPATTPAPAAAN